MENYFGTGDEMTETTAIDLLSSFAGYDTVIDKTGSFDHQDERIMIKKFDQEQTEFNEKNRQTAFYFPSTKSEIQVGSNEKTKVIHSSVNVFDEDEFQMSSDLKLRIQRGKAEI